MLFQLIVKRNLSYWTKAMKKDMRKRFTKQLLFFPNNQYLFRRAYIDDRNVNNELLIKYIHMAADKLEEQIDSLLGEYIQSYIHTLYPN